MKTLISILVYTSLVFVLPIYGSFISDRIKAREWKKAVTHGLIALVIVCAAFFLGWYGLATQTASAARILPKLEYLNGRDYEEEIKLKRQKNQLTSVDQVLQIVRNKFDEAEYAHSKQHLQKTQGVGPHFLLRNQPLATLHSPLHSSPLQSYCLQTSLC
jgi:hypothetical protein